MKERNQKTEVRSQKAEGGSRSSGGSRPPGAISAATKQNNSEDAKAESRKTEDRGRKSEFRIQKSEISALPLSDQERDILTLLNAASVEGIAPDGLLAQAGAAGVQIARDTALAALRRFARHGLATMRGNPPRFYITGVGSALCGGGLDSENVRG